MSDSAAVAASTSAADSTNPVTNLSDSSVERALRVGDPVLVYSVSQKKWFPGEIAKVLDESPDSPTASVCNSTPQYVSVRYWIGHTHRAKRVAGNSKDMKRVTHGINRFDWDIGTILECWSNTKQSWFTAKVTDIRRVNGGYDSDGEVDSNRIWLELQWEMLNEVTGDTKRLSKEFALSSYWIRYSHKHASQRTENAQSSRKVANATPADNDVHSSRQSDTPGGITEGSATSATDTDDRMGLPINRISSGKRDRSGSSGSTGRSRRRSGSGSSSSGIDNTTNENVSTGMRSRSSKRRRSQGKKTVVESYLSQLLDPNSQLVYMLANGAVILIMFSMLVLYIISPSIHFLIMGLLSLGLFLSVNYVWKHRNLAMHESNRSKQD